MAPPAYLIFTLVIWHVKDSELFFTSHLYTTGIHHYYVWYNIYLHIRIRNHYPCSYVVYLSVFFGSPILDTHARYVLRYIPVPFIVNQLKTSTALSL